MKVPYDFLIVGSGLFGAVIAREMTDLGKKCLVLEKRHHIGGNLFCENIMGINVHRYGPHIFHTNDKQIWDYVNRYCTFNNFIYSPMANYKGELYNLPFNMNTFYQLWKTQTPKAAEDHIKSQISTINNRRKPKNLADQALKMVGVDIYNKLIKGYTEKQWGRDAVDLPPSIIKRLPVRFSFDNNYFDDKYQGIPVGGYNVLINGLLKGIEVRTNVDFISNRACLSELGAKLIYTGKLDEYFSYRHGCLEYRSLRFEHEFRDIPNYQGVAVVNFTEREVPFTRIIEHKHFEFGKQPGTVITREFPEEWQQGMEAFYPINDVVNTIKFKKYRALAECEENIFFGGRLAEYKYYDMHQVIASALKRARSMNC